MDPLDPAHGCMVVLLFFLPRGFVWYFFCEGIDNNFSRTGAHARMVPGGYPGLDATGDCVYILPPRYFPRETLLTSPG